MISGAMTAASGEEAVSRFADGVRRLRERREAAQAALSGARATVSSPDGAVTATVDSAGVLTGLHFTPAAMEGGLPALSAAVLTTARQARVRMLEQAEQQVAAIVGEANPAVDLLREQAARFAEPAEPEADDVIGVPATDIERFLPPGDEAVSDDGD